MKNYRRGFGIRITIKYGKTGMDQLNVQQTWPPVPGMKTNAGNDTK